MTFGIGDPVLWRRNPAEHERTGRVVGRSIGRRVYDIRDDAGALHLGVTTLRLDEDAMRAIREQEGV